MKNVKEKLKILWELYSVLFKIGICTFGGGLAMLPILERELAQKRKWTDSNELLDWFAIGQSTPGIIAVNVATFVGYKIAGVIGGLVGVLGMISPSVIIITVIAKFISNFSSLTWVQCALTGINISVAALLTSAVWSVVRKSIKNTLGFILFALSFVAIFFFKVDTVWVIILSAYVGVLAGALKGLYKKTGVIIAGILIVGAFAGIHIYGAISDKEVNENVSVQSVSETAVEVSPVVTEDTENIENSGNSENSPVTETTENIAVTQTDSLTSENSPVTETPSPFDFEEAKQRCSLLFLFCIFFYMGLITIGGGIVGITIMQQILVDKYQLLSPELFFNMVAISESTPGPLGINMATYLGTELYGIGGGLITSLGEVSPAIICILLIAKYFSRFADRAGVKAGFETLRPAVSGAIAVAAVNIFIIAILNLPSSVSEFAHAKTWLNLINIPHALFYAVALVVLAKTKLHPLFIVLAGALFGVIIHYWLPF